MKENPVQEEMFPDIAKAAQKDIVTERREGHKKVSDIFDMRKLGRYLGAQKKEQKQLELEKIRKEIIESDPANNPNQKNLQELFKK